MTLELYAWRFWNASHFVRRSDKTDLTLAVKILEQVAADAPEPLADRAITVLVEIDNEHCKRTGNS